MSVPLECPWDESYEAFFDAALSPLEQDRYARHLESCPTCQYRLDRAEEGEDEFRRLGRQLGDPTSASTDAALSNVVHRLHEVKSPLHAAVGAEDLHFLTPSDRPGVLGTLGEYEITGVIGRGGMGVVLEAFDPLLRRVVAIKVMAASVAGSPIARRRFTREAHAAAAVCHDHIVTVHGVHEQAGLPYLVMQYVAGESLQSRIDREGPLEIAEIIRIGQQTAAGLAAAHALGLIHRDIKPANLLLEMGNGEWGMANGEWRMGNREWGMGNERMAVLHSPFPIPHSPFDRVKITDFGLARMTDDVQLTRTGELAGTPEYMAPEQARGEQVDHRADLFSLGSVLYAMCAGVPPFRAASTVAVLRMVSDRSPAPIRDLNPDVPDWLATLIERLMEKNPANRLSSAAEVASLLEGYLANSHQPPTLNVAEPAESPYAVAEVDCWSLRLLRTAYWLTAAVVLLSLTGLSLLLQLQNADVTPKRVQKEFYQNFRGSKSVDPVLLWTGKDGDEVIQLGEKGLRIQLPATRRRTDPVGPVLRSQIKGDVEISAGYEILQADRPETGSGVGVELYVLLDSAEVDSFSCCRVKGRTGLDVYSCTHNYTRDGNRQHLTIQSGASAKSGRLRMTRKDGNISFAVSDGDGGFRELCRYVIEPSDIKEIRIAAYPGSSTQPVDVRILDLKVNSTSGISLAAPPVSVPGTEAAISRGWLVATMIIGLVFAMTILALGGWFWFVRTRQGNVARDLPGNDSRPLVDTPAPVITFACAGCGKTIRAKPKLAGQKAKCPQCGEPISVPSFCQSVSVESPATAPQGTTTRKKGLIVAVIGVLLFLSLLGGWIVLARRSHNDVLFQAIENRSFLDMVLGREPVSGVEESGFSYQEFDQAEPFRWTDGKARLTIPLRQGEVPQALRLQLASYRSAGANAALAVVVNGRQIFNGKVRGGKSEATYDLRGIALGRQVIVDLVSDTYHPLGGRRADGKPSDDTRSLGVLVRGVILMSKFPATPPAPVQGVAANIDPAIRIWKGHLAGVSCAAVTADGKMLLSGSWDGEIKKWHVAANGKSTIMPIRVPMLSAIAVSPSGDLFVTAGNNRRIRVWSMTTTHSSQSFARAATAVVGNRSGNVLTSIVSAGCAVSLGKDTGGSLFDLVGPAGQVLALAVSPDGETLAAGGGDPSGPGELKLWSMKTGKELTRVEPFKLRLWSLAFAPDNKSLVVGTGDGRADIVSVQTGKIDKTHRHPAYVRSVAWSADGKWIATACDKSGLVSLYEAAGDKKMQFQVPGGRLVVGLNFTRNGKFLLTSCRDTTAYLWDLGTSPPQVAKSRRTHPGRDQFGLLFPDDRTAAAGGDDGNIYLWDMSQDQATTGNAVPARAIVLDEPPVAEREKWSTFQHSFKGQLDKKELFELIGPDASQCVKNEQEGLRITLPLGHPEKRLATGVAANIPIKGDFEITIGFEILAEPGVKESEQGTGVFIGVDLDTPTTNRTTLTRGSRADAGTAFTTWLSLTHDDADKPYADLLRSFSTQAKKGRLRLLRIGSVLYFYAAEDMDKTFKLLRKDSFRPDKVQQIRIGGYTGGPQASLDARMLDLQIRTRTPLDLPADSSLSFARAMWLTSTGFLALGICVITVFGVWLHAHNRHRRNLALASEASRKEPVHHSSPAEQP